MAISGPVRRITDRTFSQNTYFYPIQDAKCLLIDPGIDFEQIHSALLDSALVPVGIFCTHGHFDHIGSVKQFQQRYSCPFYMHEADVKISKSSNFLLRAFKMGMAIDIPTPDTLIRGEESAFRLGDKEIRWIHTPGHTPGSCVINIDDNIFTGDTLYKNSVGYSDLPGQNKDQLVKSLAFLLECFPGKYRIYPGHGEDDLLENVRRNNSDLKELLGSAEPEDNAKESS